ncbi:DNA-directed RNA polymerase subunit alpha C-terminal domain-containing protein [Nonomuraea polychroma]|uniref:DNA-directed RNA polymerase subunit alpha C-terminal domain-containing protein n=1 Tax=Nonomuraea polychroma TaxID=46176 RepID=UPI003D91323F
MSVLPDITPGPPGQCFANAAHLADTRPDLTYCEGVVYTRDLGTFDHAWCVDAGDHVIDPTLPGAYATAHVGIPLTRTYRRTEKTRRGSDAVLTSDHTTFLTNDDALRAGLPAAATAATGQPLPLTGVTALAWAIPLPAATPIEALTRYRLSIPTVNSLQRAGILTIGRLRGMDERTLRKIKNFGPRRMDNLTETLAAARAHAVEPATAELRP